MGTILTGGLMCYVCGNITARSEIAYPFGKSDQMRPVCDDHATLQTVMAAGPDMLANGIRIGGKLYRLVEVE